MFFTKKKSAALLLALLMAASAFTGCAGSEDGSGDAAVDGTTAVTTAASAEETAFSYTANVPAGTNYNGYEFRICVYDQSNAVWHDVDFSAETETGDTINDAVYKRNKKIEQIYNFKVVEIGSDSAHTMAKTTIITEKATNAATTAAAASITATENYSESM